MNNDLIIIISIWIGYSQPVSQIFGGKMKKMQIHSMNEKHKENRQRQRMARIVMKVNVFFYAHGPYSRQSVDIFSVTVVVGISCSRMKKKTHHIYIWWLMMVCGCVCVCVSNTERSIRNFFSVCTLFVMDLVSPKRDCVCVCMMWSIL